MSEKTMPVPPEALGISHSEVAKILGYAKRTPSHEEIARRAYEIYLARAGKPASAVDDWLQAERELTGGR